MSYTVYKLIHYVGIFMASMSLAGIAFVSAEKKPLAEHPLRLMAVISHGVGLLLVLLGGFGMLARLGIIGDLPGWVLGKLGIWVLLGGALALVKRVPSMARVFLGLLLIAMLAAVYLALYKPI